MKISRIAIITICLITMVSATWLTSEAATSFNRSTIMSIDETQRTITFQTREGQTWTLPLADPNILKKEQVARGDQVSIEIDLSDRITKIIKLGETPRSERSITLDDLKP
jgi:hypothetical protein